MSTDQKISPTAADKKEAQRQAQRYNLHVMLIMEQSGKTKAQAQFAAWLEGPGGLSRRMPVAEPSTPPK